MTGAGWPPLGWWDGELASTYPGFVRMRSAGEVLPVKRPVVVVVEDDTDVQDLIETVFSLDFRFILAGVSATAEDALEMAQTNEAGLIVLDHRLAGELTGLQAAPKFKEVAPQSKLILFTAHGDLYDAATAEPAVDAFLIKTESTRLLNVAQKLLGMAGFI